jgi:hypothetical protein
MHSIEVDVAPTLVLFENKKENHRLQALPEIGITTEMLEKLENEFSSD